MRKSESTFANPVLFIPKIYENWMWFVIIKSMYHRHCLSRGGVWKIAVRPIQGFNQCQMMPTKCTTAPSMLILLDLTDKLHIDTKKNCYVTSHQSILKVKEWRKTVPRPVMISRYAHK